MGAGLDRQGKQVNVVMNIIFLELFRPFFFIKTSVHFEMFLQ